jgi:Cdc6-like AAA superfamily ATPase
MNKQLVDYFSLSLQAGQVFTPNTPVNVKDLFSGRTDQIRKIADVIFQRGQHAIIFGERGVGKTSLANVLKGFLPDNQDLIINIINCDKKDTFKSVWKKVFDGIHIVNQRMRVGYKSEYQPEIFQASDFLKDDENIPHQILKFVSQLSENKLPVLIIDEFDRLTISARKLFPDFIKSLSDHSLSATIILIGVGESIEYLIKDHQSVSRSLIQIQMPRMNLIEVEGVITNGLNRLGMTIEKNTLNKIKLLVKGLPYYAHLIGLNATRSALQNNSLNITDENLNEAINIAITDSQHYIMTNYHKAIRSSRKENLFADVLLACAYANVNELGEFAAQDLREPMNKITGRNYNIPGYARHLKEFCSENHGKILIKSGVRKKFRYKFSDPLMQPYVIMQGIIRGINP